MTHAVVVITGSPGAGKTTLSRLLAASSDDGLRIDADAFYAFPGRPIAPTQPESQQQNVTIMRALGACAGAFRAGGYRVYLDGIFGPWFLDTLREALPEGCAVDYVVLDIDRDDAIRRVQGRDGPGSTPAAGQMHAAFRDLGAFEAHRVAVDGMTTEALAERVRDGLGAGAFRLG